MRLGEHTTEKQLAEDWTMTHELSHMAFPSLPDEQHWMEEGMATYVEPIARVQAGQLTAKQIWKDMMEGMPKGEPGPEDEGLDRTHTWGRTYWGGALFCLVADVEIRKETKNRKGLQDALRAIVDQGGTINQDWPITRAFEVGDKATGTRVLEELYGRWNTSPVTVDLAGLWKEMGVRLVGDSVEFDAKAPLARAREGITAKR
jgi:predicted metalloprotease with PDZ domain